jgi:hypothetical protein
MKIGSDKNQVHFLIKRVLIYSSTPIAKIIKSITAREIFSQAPDVDYFNNNAPWACPGALFMEKDFKNLLFFIHILNR